MFQPCASAHVYTVDSVEECAAQPRPPNSTAIPLLRWLLRDPVAPDRNFSSRPSSDGHIPRRSQQAWQRNDMSLDPPTFVTRSRTNRNDYRIRLDIFRGLYESVRRVGFDWHHSPIIVDPAFSIVDGTHRVAGSCARLRHANILPPLQCANSTGTQHGRGSADASQPSSMQAASCVVAPDRAAISVPGQHDDAPRNTTPEQAPRALCARVGLREHL